LSRLRNGRVASEPATAEPHVHAPATVDPAWFAAPVCRNCDGPLTGAHCAACGQKAVKRLTLKDVVKETWERLRLFEGKAATTLRALVTGPGGLARAYVLGRRTRVMHPLTLLIALVAILVATLAINGYFTRYAGGPDAGLKRMADQVLAYANWSFTLGIAAVFLGSWSIFRRRLGYNAVEHAVLAIYVQCLVLAVVIVNMIPTLIWRDAAFVVAHKAASAWYLYAIKLAIVAFAFRQFFLLSWRRDWPRLIAAALVYLAASWLLLRAYAAAILWFVG
jgi:hypothetical protein